MALVVAGTAVNGGNGVAAPLPISLPASISAGDLLIVYCITNSSSLSVPSGWTAIAGSPFSAGVAPYIMNAWYKIASGSEGSSVGTGTQDGGGYFCSVSYRITGAGNGAIPVMGLSGQTTYPGTTNPDPPLLTLGTSQETLWIEGAWDGSSITITAASAGYSNFVGYVSASIRFASASKISTASSENPGVMTSAQVPWGAFTSAVWYIAATVPAAPTIGTATPTGTTTTTLTWTDNGNGGASITSHEIWRGTTPGGETQYVAGTGSSTTTYYATGLSAGTLYYWKVKAINSVGSSVLSGECSGTTYTAVSTSDSGTGTDASSPPTAAIASSDSGAGTDKLGPSLTGGGVAAVTQAYGSTG